MLSGYEIVPGRPLKGGILASFSALMMHVPVEVPAKGAPTVTLDTEPFELNVIEVVA
jgi:hypothetical protein